MSERKNGQAHKDEEIRKASRPDGEHKIKSTYQPNSDKEAQTR